MLAEQKLQEIGTRRKNSLETSLRRDSLHSRQGFMLRSCGISEELQHKMLRRHECVLDNEEHFQHPLPGKFYLQSVKIRVRKAAP